MFDGQGINGWVDGEERGRPSGEENIVSAVGIPREFGKRMESVTDSSSPGKSIYYIGTLYFKNFV